MTMYYTAEEAEAAAIEQYDTAVAKAKPTAKRLAELIDAADTEPDTWDSIMETMEELEAAVRMADSRHRMVGAAAASAAAS